MSTPQLYYHEHTGEHSLVIKGDSVYDSEGNIIGPLSYLKDGLKPHKNSAKPAQQTPQTPPSTAGKTYSHPKTGRRGLTIKDGLVYVGDMSLGPAASFNEMSGPLVEEVKEEPKPETSPAPARDDSRNNNGIEQRGTNMGAGLAAFDLAAAEKYMGGPITDLSTFAKREGLQGVSGIGPVADGEVYAAGINATKDTSGIGPVADGEVYGQMLQTGEAQTGGMGFDMARRRAFLDADSSMAGWKAVQALKGHSRAGGKNFANMNGEMVEISNDDSRAYMNDRMSAQDLLSKYTGAITASQSQEPNFEGSSTDPVSDNAGLTETTPDIEGVHPLGAEFEGFGTQIDFNRANTAPVQVDPAGINTELI